MSYEANECLASIDLYFGKKRSSFQTYKSRKRPHVAIVEDYTTLTEDDISNLTNGRETRQSIRTLGGVFDSKLNDVEERSADTRSGNNIGNGKLDRRKKASIMYRLATLVSTLGSR